MMKDQRLEEGCCFFPFVFANPSYSRYLLISGAICNILPPSLQFIDDIKWGATPSALKMTIWLSKAGLGILFWSLQK